MSEHKVDKNAAARNKRLFEQLEAARAEGNPAAVSAAETALLEANTGLVGALAKRYHMVGGESDLFADIVSAGTIGLLDAIRKWNPEHATLGVFARAYISGALRREVCRVEARSQGQTYTTWQAQPKVAAAVAALRASGEQVTVEAVARKAKLTVETVQVLLSTAPASLSTPVGADDSARTLLDVVASRTEEPVEDVTEDAVARLSAITSAGVVSAAETYMYLLRSPLSGAAPELLADVAALCGRTRSEAAAAERRVSAAMVDFALVFTPEKLASLPEFAVADLVAEDPRDGHLMAVVSTLSDDSVAEVAAWLPTTDLVVRMLRLLPVARAAVVIGLLDAPLVAAVATSAPPRWFKEVQALRAEAVENVENGEVKQKVDPPPTKKHIPGQVQLFS